MAILNDFDPPWKCTKDYTVERFFVRMKIDGPTPDPGLDKVMTVHVLFFGAIADIAGVRSLELPIAKDLNSDLFMKEMVTRFPGLASHRMHLSINQQHATGDTVIRDGDELAVFTAVSGG